MSYCILTPMLALYVFAYYSLCSSERMLIRFNKQVCMHGYYSKKKLGSNSA